MKSKKLVTLLALLLLTANANAAVLAAGTKIGVDFSSAANAAANPNSNNFNLFSTTSGTVGAGGLIDTSAVMVDGVGITWAGYAINGQAAAIGGEPDVFNSYNLADWLLGRNTITLTFTGLNAGFTYDLIIAGGSAAAAIVDTTWTVDGQTATTAAKTPGSAHVSFTGLKTDGSGNLLITGINPISSTSFSALSALHLTAVPEASTSALIGIFGAALLARRKRS